MSALPKSPYSANVALLMWLIVIFDLAFIGFAMTEGLRTHDNPAYYFDEGRMGTLVSVLQLLAIAGMAFVTLWIRKRETPWTGWHTPWAIWALLGAGFVFLAVDDGFKIHERMDGIIHKIFGLQQTALTDRLDDAIIGIYGILGLLALYLYRRELVRFRQVLPFMILAFAAAFLQVLLDMAGNRKDLVQMIFENRKTARIAHHWTEAMEGGTQLLAEGLFLIAFFAVAVVASRPALAPEINPETAPSPSSEE